MDHLLVKAAAAATTDRGEFTARAAAYTVDRDGDRIVPGAFKDTIRAWRESGKRIPLHWGHDDAARSIIGSVDPARMRETDDGLIVEGRVDLDDSEMAREAWRSVRDNRISLSFGALVDEKRPGADGATELVRLDLFEISLVPAPAQPDTRILSFKTTGDLKARADRVARDVEEARIPRVPPAARSPLEQAVNAAPAADAVAFAKALDGTDAGEGMRLHVRLVTADEHAGIRDGIIQAAWSSAYVDALPDTCFLHIQPGGSRDDEGKTTPRSLRRFPVRDAAGTVDAPRARNAAARIPQSDLPGTVKDLCAAEARRLLAEPEQSVDATGKPNPGRPVDPLRKRSEDLALEVSSGGMSLRKPPPRAPVSEPDLVPLAELRRRVRDQTLAILTGDFT